MRRLRRQIEQLDHMASHDELTGLLNRPGFRRLIERELAAEHPRGAVLLVDLDRFNEINETIGDDQGDRLLVEVAGRLIAAFPDHAPARLGEDEFAVLHSPRRRAGDRPGSGSRRRSVHRALRSRRHPALGSTLEQAPRSTRTTARTPTRCFATRTSRSRGPSTPSLVSRFTTTGTTTRISTS